ncbi:MAG: AraC family transcriptional regulator [Bacteroidota bacterium]
MRVLDFDINKGIFQFEMDTLSSTFHSHPALEIIYSITGCFSVETSHTQEEGLNFAVIDSNIRHCIVAQDCTVRLLMLEKNNDQLNIVLEQFGIVLDSGIFILNSNERSPNLLENIKQLAAQKSLKTPKDNRVAVCLEIIETHDLEYDSFVASLISKVHLSESRLSHLFKQHTGVSLKKYFVWVKLKKAIHMVLNNNKSLTEASFESGFFDQPHMSKAFKTMLGIAPIKAYNSRTVQF